MTDKMNFADFLHTLSGDKPLAIFVASVGFAALIFAFLFLRSLFGNHGTETKTENEKMTDKETFFKQLLDVSDSAESLLAQLREEIKVKEQQLAAEREIQQHFGKRLQNNIDLLFIGIALGALAAGTAVYFLLQ
jgi:uncharacterized protein YlxW (UPF0749 family)